MDFSIKTEAKQPRDAQRKKMGDHSFPLTLSFKLLICLIFYNILHIKQSIC